jgi:multiple sugar transport system ATP-binding protein
VFRAEGVAAPLCRSAPEGPAILGVRPEDCRVAGGEGHLAGSIYGLEPTGDQTFLTVRTAADQVEIKADRDFRAPLDSPVSIAFDPGRLYLFDAADGARIR